MEEVAAGDRGDGGGSGSFHGRGWGGDGSIEEGELVGEEEDLGVLGPGLEEDGGWVGAGEVGAGVPGLVGAGDGGGPEELVGIEVAGDIDDEVEGVARFEVDRSGGHVGFVVVDGGGEEAAVAAGEDEGADAVAGFRFVLEGALDGDGEA